MSSAANPGSTPLAGRPLVLAPPPVARAARPRPRGFARRLADGLAAADRLVRLHFLCFTHSLVLLGAASATELAGADGPRFGVVLQLLVVAWLFHTFAYVFNDVVDLPIDRSQPLRANDPLVRGELDVRWVLALALATIPAAAFQTWCLGGGLQAQLVLLGSFAAMAAYNVWGKRCPWSPLTDLAQGLGWGGLVFWAALVVAGEVNAWTWVAALSGILYILLINGVHGGLRDLDNDLRTGSRTTAILLGARPRPHQDGACPASMTRSLALFAILVQLAAIAVSAWSLWLAPATMAAWLFLPLLAAINIWTLSRVLRVDLTTWQRDFRLHLFWLLVPPVAAFAPHLSPFLLATLLTAFLVPFLFFEITQDLARDAWERLRR